MIWPFAPRTPIAERLYFRTEVLAAYGAEQRLALRAAPRQAFTFAHVFTPEQAGRARLLARAGSGGTWRVPVWPELRNVGALTLGQTVIAIDTTAGDFRGAGSEVLVWGSDTAFEAATISAMTGSSITLSAGLGAAYARALVMPLRTGYEVSSFEVGPVDAAHGTASIAFEVTDNVDLSAAAAPVNYDGRPVLVEAPAISTPLLEAVANRQALIDSGVGQVARRPVQDYLEAGRSFMLREIGLPAAWARRSWLHALRGRQGSFWAPTWGQDLRPLAAIGSADTEILVAATAAPADLIGAAVMIRRKDGTIYRRRIEDAAADTGGDLVTLDAALGADLALADLDRISIMPLVRLDSDTIEIRHFLAGYAEFSATLIEVPDVL